MRPAAGGTWVAGSGTRMPGGSGEQSVISTDTSDPAKRKTSMRHLSDGAARLDIAAVGSCEAYLVVSVVEPLTAVGAVSGVWGAVAESLTGSGLIVVHERVFGSLAAAGEALAARAKALQARGVDPGGPVTYVEGRPPWGDGLAGVIIRAVAPALLEGPVGEIGEPGAVRGRTWRSGGATFVVLQDVRDAQATASSPQGRATSVRRMIREAERLLRERGFSYRDVVRTWFYLPDILAWYPAFNAARNELYEEYGLMRIPGVGARLLPGSTGIGGRMPGSSSPGLDLAAVVAPESSAVRVRRLSSPVQIEAFRYGSAFARAVLVERPGCSTIHVSGTAAVDEAGVSLHGGDFHAQVECTLERIAALLEPEGTNLTDIVAATAFVKRGGDAGVLAEVLGAHGLAELPAVCVVADVCRDELLFEMEAEIALARPPSSASLPARHGS